VAKFILAADLQSTKILQAEIFDQPGSWLVSSAVPSARRSGLDANSPLFFHNFNLNKKFIYKTD
jgi:hypothetical protein